MLKSGSSIYLDFIQASIMTACISNFHFVNTRSLGRDNREFPSQVYMFT